MGNWKLEVGRMAIYTSFPVVLFHYFNQPAYFEEWVTNTKREMYPPENVAERETYYEAVRAIRKRELKTMERSAVAN